MLFQLLPQLSWCKTEMFTKGTILLIKNNPRTRTAQRCVSPELHLSLALVNKNDRRGGRRIQPRSKTKLGQWSWLGWSPQVGSVVPIHFTFYFFQCCFFLKRKKWTDYRSGLHQHIAEPIDPSSGFIPVDPMHIFVPEGGSWPAFSVSRYTKEHDVSLPTPAVRAANCTRCWGHLSCKT